MSETASLSYARRTISNLIRESHGFIEESGSIQFRVHHLSGSAIIRLSKEFKIIGIESGVSYATALRVAVKLRTPNKAIKFLRQTDMSSV